MAEQIGMRSIMDSEMKLSVQIDNPDLIRVIWPSKEAPRQFVSGAIGGLAGLVVGHPMDTVKVLMQSSSQHLNIVGVMKSLKSNGLTLYFTGLAVPFYSYGLVNALNFTTYKQCMHYLDSANTRSSALAGAFVGLVQLIPSIPTDVIKIRQQNRILMSMEQLTVTECIGEIWRKQGFRGFYTGSLMQGLRDVPAFAWYFFGYAEGMKIGASMNLSLFWSAFFAGAFGGALSWITTMPMDVLKTRVQSNQHTTIISAFKDLVSERKFSAYFRGFNMAITRALIVNACTFAVFESVYGMLSSSDFNIHSKDSVRSV